MTSAHGMSNEPADRLRALSTLALVMADTLAGEIADAATITAEAIVAGHKVLICGNGGSASQAAHFAGELVGRFKRDRAALPAIPLTEVGIITATGNDDAFANVFARQIEAYGAEGDVLVCLSTSGCSANVLRARETGQLIGMRTIAIVGANAPSEWEACDALIRVPSSDTALVQEVSLCVAHTICGIVEDEVCGE